MKKNARDFMVEYKTECIHFTGEKPCVYDIHCKECLKFSPRGKKILVIATHTLKELMPVTSIFEGLTAQYDKSYITLLIDNENLWVFEENKMINEIIIYEPVNIFFLLTRKFDILINLDTTYKGTSLTSLINAEEKLGIGISKEGNIIPLNERADPWFQTKIISSKRRENVKSIPNLLYDSIRLSYRNQEYYLPFDESFRKQGIEYLKSKGIFLKKPAVCLSALGSTGELPLMLLPQHIDILFDLLTKEGLFTIVLCEQKRVDDRNYILSSSVDNKTRAAIISCFDIMVSGDTLDLHLAIALKLKTIGIFGPTLHQEVSLFGRGTKVVSDKTCAPCLKDKCIYPEDNCMKKINVNGLIKVVQKLIG
ncbi:MAG: glycosyltransferase family 9 protein [Candidatus Hydrogenedentota bacterium]